LANRGCLPANCHGAPGAERVSADGKTTWLSVDMEELDRSAHRELACLECHTDIESVPHAKTLKQVQCENCHFEENPRAELSGRQFREYIESIHGRRAKEGDPDMPRCATCHGTHGIEREAVETSLVHRARQPDVCGRCHQPERDEYEAGVHGSELRSGNLDVPTCTGCHGVHRILEPAHPESPVAKAHVVETCKECHAAVEIAAKYGFSVKRVQTYEGSFHGFANKYRVTVAANCASCHGNHGMLPQSDPRSPIHPSNLAATCGQARCHENAVAAFASGQVHLGVAAPPPLVVDLAEKVYIVLIVLLIGGMAAHNLWDLRSHRRGGR
jgi:hypothetical protein